MREYKDYYGNSIVEGDIISMPHVEEEQYKDRILNGHYISQVFYDAEGDRLITDSGNGFGLAFGVVRLNIR